MYGFAANLAARLCGVAQPGMVAVSDAVAPLVRDSFELHTDAPVAVKGVKELINLHQVLGERREAPARESPPLVGRDGERGWLQHSWQQARAGLLSTPGVVFRGEPGIGKTRLAKEAAEIVESSRRDRHRTQGFATAHRHGPTSSAEAVGAAMRDHTAYRRCRAVAVA